VINIVSPILSPTVFSTPPPSFFTSPSPLLLLSPSFFAQVRSFSVRLVSQDDPFLFLVFGFFRTFSRPRFFLVIPVPPPPLVLSQGLFQTRRKTPHHHLLLFPGSFTNFFLLPASWSTTPAYPTPYSFLFFVLKNTTFYSRPHRRLRLFTASSSLLAPPSSPFLFP